MSRKFWYIVISMCAILVLAGGAFGLTQVVGNAAAKQIAHKTSGHKGHKGHRGTPTPKPPTPTPTPGNPGSGSTTSQIAQAVFNAINQSRAAAGLPALQWSSALANGAHLHNQRMAAANQLSHQLPGEPDLGTRISQDGIQWTWAGENIGLTSDATVNGALGLHKAMMAEQPPNDGHRQNILTTQGNMVGVDILIDGKGQLWLTEDFARA